MKEYKSLLEIIKKAKEHSCELGKKIISDDDYKMRRVGFTCTNCMEKFQVGLTAFRGIKENKEIPLRIRKEEGRASLAKDLNR